MEKKRPLALPEAFFSKWQSILDLIVEMIGVPSALIMRVHEREIEVYVTSQNPETPYQAHEFAPLKTGLYCETVINTQEQLIVPNALADENWNKNPDIKLGMIAYAGLPIIQQNGKVFGTICILDKQANNFGEQTIALLEQFRNLVQDDIRLYELNSELEQKNKENNELIHVLCHDLRNPIGAGQFLIDELIENLKNQEVTLSASLETITDTKMILDDALQVIDHVRDLRYLREKYATTRVKTSQLNLRDAMDFVVQIFQHQLQAKRLTIRYDLPPELYVIAEESSLINSVLSNVVSNAIKFSYPGSYIDCKHTIKAHTVELSITDYGTGMTKSMLTNLFEVTSRSSIGTMGEKGSGFGMPLVKRFMEEYPQGEIKVISGLEGQKGTSVVLTFQMS